MAKSHTYHFTTAAPMMSKATTRSDAATPTIRSMTSTYPKDVAASLHPQQPSTSLLEQRSGLCSRSKPRDFECTDATDDVS